MEANEKNSLVYLRNLVPEKRVVQCVNCNRVHMLEDKTYVAFWGMITVGVDGDLIGPNLDSEGKVTGGTFVCIGGCLEDFLQNTFGEALGTAPF